MIRPLSTDPDERIAELEEKVAQAYQIIATLLANDQSDPALLPWPDNTGGKGVVF